MFILPRPGLPPNQCRELPRTQMPKCPANLPSQVFLVASRNSQVLSPAADWEKQLLKRKMNGQIIEQRPLQHTVSASCQQTQQQAQTGLHVLCYRRYWGYQTTGYGMQMVPALSASGFALLDLDQLGRQAMTQLKGWLMFTCRFSPSCFSAAVCCCRRFRHSALSADSRSTISLSKTHI